MPLWAARPGTARAAETPGGAGDTIEHFARLAEAGAALDDAFPFVARAARVFPPARFGRERPASWPAFLSRFFGH